MAKTANSPYGALQLNSASAVTLSPAAVDAGAGWGYRCKRCRGGLGLRVTKDVGGSDLYKVDQGPGSSHLSCTEGQD